MLVMKFLSRDHHCSSRRTILKKSSAVVGGLGLGLGLGVRGPFSSASAADKDAGGKSKRKFTIDLTPGAIGIGADPRAVIDLAQQHGFESVQPNAGFLASLDAAQRKEIPALLQQKNLAWGSTGMPVDFRGAEEKFREGMAALPIQAAALRDAGVTRISTWLKPFHDSLTYLANFKQHVARLGEVNQVLADHGLRFGLEYVGTKTLWTKERYSFIHTMAETKELLAEIGQPTLGFVLDSWHWWTAGESAADILTLENEDVVACDLNDAPLDIPVEEQLDNQRELPAATGVIPIGEFLKALVQIGYDGPVRAEPFNKPLRELEDEPAAKATAEALRKAVEVAGV
jgi:sugar phosphate isomerase/epimerase